MTDPENSVIEQLEQHLRQAERDWKSAIEEDDTIGATYAGGKQSAFITAIEAVTDCATDSERDHGDGDE